MIISEQALPRKDVRHNEAKERKKMFDVGTSSLAARLVPSLRIDQFDGTRLMGGVGRLFRDPRMGGGQARTLKEFLLLLDHVTAVSTLSHICHYKWAKALKSSRKAPNVCCSLQMRRREDR
jgi:hypothetical protein